MYLRPAVVVDETKLPEFIHENIDGLAGGVQQALVIQQNSSATTAKEMFIDNLAADAEAMYQNE
jgi:hypothetical protein